MGQYSPVSFGFLGNTVSIQLWQDNAGSPGALLSEFQETISSVNTNGTLTASNITQKYVNFTSPISIAANTTYWISMSGGTMSGGSELALLSLNSVENGASALFVSGNTLVTSAIGIGDVSMRLYSSSSVPDGGSSIAMLGLALTAMAGARRKFGI